MSLTSANEQLEKVMMELDNKMFEARSLDQTVVTQAYCLKSISLACMRMTRDIGPLHLIDILYRRKYRPREHSQLSQEHTNAWKGSRNCIKWLMEFRHSFGSEDGIYKGTSMN